MLKSGIIIPILNIILVLSKILLDNKYCPSAKLSEKTLAPVTATPCPQQRLSEKLSFHPARVLSERYKMEDKPNRNFILLLQLKLKNLADEFEDKREREEGEKINDLETIIQTDISEQQEENRFQKKGTEPP